MLLSVNQLRDNHDKRPVGMPIALWEGFDGTDTGDDYTRCCDEWAKAGGDALSMPSRDQGHDEGDDYTYEGTASLVDERPPRGWGSASKAQGIGSVDLYRGGHPYWDEHEYRCGYKGCHGYRGGFGHKL